MLGVGFRSEVPIYETMRSHFVKFSKISFNLTPEIFRLEGYVFFFYANEGNEPMHVHVRRGGGYAKFWLEPLELDYAKGLKTKEIVRAEIIITENLETIRRKWHDVFGT